MTRMPGPDWAIMYNLRNTQTHTHLDRQQPGQQLIVGPALHESVGVGIRVHEKRSTVIWGGFGMPLGVWKIRT